jgi:putative ABC transport system permease protein
MNPLPVVVADLRRSPWSSLAVLLLLSLAFCGTIATSVFERALRNAGADTAVDFDLVVGAPGSRVQLVLSTVFLQTNDVLPLLPWSAVDVLATDPRVAAVSPLVFADNYDGFPIVGGGPEFRALRPLLHLAHGRWPQAPFEVVAGSSTGLEVGGSLQSAQRCGRRRAG